MLIFISVPTKLTAQQAPKSHIIAGVTVEGNRFADEQTIIALSGLRIGSEIKIPGAQQQEALRNLWSRNQFSDVAIEIEKTTALGIFLIIRVKEFPRLSWIDAQGNSELSVDDIRKAVGKSRGDIISPYDRYLAKKSLKAAYEKEGIFYPSIEISEREIGGDTVGYVILEINIKEGAEFKVHSVNFSGNKSIPSSDLASTLENTHTSSWWKFWSSNTFDRHKYEEDKQALLTYYHSNGYIDVEILNDSVRLVPDEEGVHIYIELYEGNQYYIRDVSVEGNTVFASDLLLRRINVYKGDVYDEPLIEKQLSINEDQTDAASLYYDTGYLSAQLIKEATKVAKDSVDLVIRVFERQRFTVRRVEIVGNTKTKDKVIRRELFTRPGDYFSRSAMIRSVRGLGVLNYFNPEALRPNVLPVDNTQVDLSYRVEERSTDTFNASLGIAGSFGLTGSVGITLNNFSLAEPLRGGGGQILNLNLQFGQGNQFQDYSLSFTEPWLNNEPTTLGVNFYHSRYRFQFNQDRTGLTANIGRRLRFPDDYFRVDGNVVAQYLSQAIDAQTMQQSLELSLGGGITRLSFDNLIFPTAGSRFALNTQLALGALGIGTTDYIRSTFLYESVTPLLKVEGNPRLVLFLSTNTGYTAQLGDPPGVLPISQFFSMGGNGLGGFFVTPLRGYPDRSIGPLTVSGNPNGRLMMRHVAEIRFALSLNPMPIYILGFTEAGNVWGTLKESDPFDLKRSAGFGLRVLLNPIGLLGFDYGYGFDSSGGSGVPNGWQFHFQFGR